MSRAGTCGNPFATTKPPRQLDPVRVDITAWLESDRCEVHCHEDMAGNAAAFGFRALTAEQRKTVIDRLREAVSKLETQSRELS